MPISFCSSEKILFTGEIERGTLSGSREKPEEPFAVGP
jgi:hypothetical protein